MTRLGPVIRINPDEVHINDRDYWDKLYTMTNGRTEKTPSTAETFGPFAAVRQPLCLFRKADKLTRRQAIGTQSHELYRIRRAPLNPFFSKKSVNDLTPVIRRPLEILCQRLDPASKTGETQNMKYFYNALTPDIINTYCFAREPESVVKPDFNRKSFDDVDGFLYVSLLVSWPLHVWFSLGLTDGIEFSYPLDYAFYQ